MKCHRCGHENPQDANFCSECGTAIARVSEDATMTFNALDLGDAQEEKEISGQLQELAEGDAMLVATRGNNHGATYLLDSDVVRAGRNPDNEIFLDDVTVSRKHAEFVRHENHFELRDTGSLNGTYVNGDRIDSVTLKANDEVQIGAFKLVFLTGPSGQ
jgi:pSer/pThr/pTyr-binding forkhead associated (FHA) protein